MDRLFALMAEAQKAIDRLAVSSQANLQEAQTLAEQNELEFALQRVYYETQRLQDEIRHLREDNERRDKDAAWERENLGPRLENQLLCAERGLPPPKIDKTGDECLFITSIFCEHLV